MDDLSSRVANLAIIEEEEDANTLQPSSPQYTPNGQHTYASSSSEFDRPSWTPNDIPGDEDVEFITTLDEYYDARSETSSRVHILLENYQIIVVSDGFGQQRIPCFRPIHAFCTFVWSPSYEYTPTRPVSAIEAPALKNNHLKDDHISFSVGP